MHHKDQRDEPAESCSRIQAYLQGNQLWGDDLSLAEIRAWHQDEAGAYADLIEASEGPYRYGYHALNRRLGFRYLPNPCRRVLSLGGATGAELQPVADHLELAVIVEPSRRLWSRSELDGPHICHVPPTVLGDLPFRDGSFDLITCFGSLHHIPNVSYVMGELARVLRPAGRAFVREPIVSMGDWRQPRRGLTVHERGIPLNLFRDMVERAEFTTVRERLAGCPLIPRLGRLLGRSAYNVPLLVELDLALTRLIRWNYCYHAQFVWEKLRPTFVFTVLERADVP